MYKNHVELIGFLGQDPELKSSANGRAFTRLSLATTDRWKDKEGQYQERTEWHTVFCWGKRAEAAARLLKKGSHVLVEGQLRSRPVTNESTGEVAVRWAIQADAFIRSGRRRRSPRPRSRRRKRRSSPRPPRTSRSDERPAPRRRSPARGLPPGRRRVVFRANSSSAQSRHRLERGDRFALPTATPGHALVLGPKVDGNTAPDRHGKATVP